MLSLSVIYGDEDVKKSVMLLWLVQPIWKWPGIARR